jgi:hypothetical protein
MGQHADMIRAVIGTMVLIFTTIAQYLLISPALYTIFGVAEATFNAGSPGVDAQLWGPRIYDILNIAYAALTAFAVLVEILACYAYARRKYYASGEVIIQ